MADGTHIEWTDATWNPITGCSVVSPGCTNCYAMRLAGTRLAHHPSRAGLTRDSKAGPVWTGEVRLNEQWLTQPLGWRRPRMVFVCAHGDLFHEAVPDEWIDRVFAIMALAPQHTFQILTKRSSRMREYLSTRAGDWTIVWPDANPPGSLPVSRHEQRLRMSTAGADVRQVRFPLPNVWLGVTAEDQARADERIPDLLATPAAVRWISAEPLLGHVDLTAVSWGDDLMWGSTDALMGVESCLEFPGEPRRARSKLDWIVVGGESQTGARPMHPDWARAIRDQCAAAGTPFFFKQWGDWIELGEADARIPRGDDQIGVRFDHHYIGRETSNRDLVMARVGKARAGRLLDGVEHNAMPAAAAKQRAMATMAAKEGGE